MTSLLRDCYTGELTYRSWTFNGFHRSKAQARIVYDDAGRVVKWNEITIEVEADIDLSAAVADDGYNSFAEAATALYRALSEPGGTLIYRGKGFGDLYVNSTVAGSLRDLNYGPKPELLAFTPIGSELVVHVVWKVTTYVVRCTDAKHKDHVFNLTWETTYDLDTDGYLSLNISGAYEIPVTFATNDGAGGPLTVVASADNWWQRVCPQTREGFQRTQNRRISRDRRRVDFTINDKELAAPIPDGATLIEARHRVKGSRSTGFFRWQNTISGTVRMNPRLPRSWSWDRFMLLVGQRIKHARGPRNQRRTVLVNEVDFDEDVFGRDQRFSVGYEILGARLHTILQASGLWLPVAGTSHASWHASMKTGPQSPRGNNGEKFTETSDVMIDLCHGPNSAQVPQPADNVRTAPAGVPDRTAESAVIDTVRTAFVGGRLSPASAQELWFPPESAWIAYTADVEFIGEDHVIRHKPLAGQVDPGRPRIVANGSASSIASDEAMDFSLSDWSVPDILQQVCSPDASVVLTGYALRFGYRINPPRLRVFGRKDVTQVREKIVEKKLGSVIGIPIWALAWRIEYALTESPRHMSTLADPLGLVNGSDAGGIGLQTFIST